MNQDKNPLASSDNSKKMSEEMTSNSTNSVENSHDNSLSSNQSTQDSRVKLRKQSENVRFLAEAGLMLALAFVLGKLKIYTMSEGGSVTLGQMAPLLLLGFRWGFIRALPVCFAYSLIKLYSGYILVWTQAMLDYTIPFSLLALTGLFANHLRTIEKKKGLELYSKLTLFTLLPVILRYICHVLSGVIFFYEYAGDKNPWVYSIIYNAFLVPDYIICIIIICLVYVPLERAFPVRKNLKMA